MTAFAPASWPSWGACGERDRLHGEPLFFERGGHRIIQILGDEQDDRTAADFDPGGGAVVAELVRRGRRDDGFIAVRARHWNAVGEAQCAGAAVHCDLGARDFLFVAPEDQRDRPVAASRAR